MPLKKYFYVLRPLLSIKWLERFQEPAPVEFHHLREMVRGNSKLNEEISKLLARKMASDEKEMAPAIPAINDFIESELVLYSECPTCSLLAYLLPTCFIYNGCRRTAQPSRQACVEAIGAL